jgi:hypothetical protein
MNIKISKLINFFFKPKKTVLVDVNQMTQEQIDEYVKSVVAKFKKTPYPKGQIDYRFNHLSDEDIFLYSRRGDDKPANIETVPHDFSVLGSDTEIYIPKR